ncbi:MULTISPECIES: xanthine dehydrogenase family protein molybdopterin-binding subunit [Prauserella salsuginis group]|uniref:Xanthine dehydrogenase D subunit n=2 Tax=Prauserella salsuginis group TaxID=2893672 RepID=A0A839XVP6_9PSEU|nr:MULTISPECIES: molybdopterin cofactor-binding domain-containing protein [Prauserella salsuginis group]MBB3664086.1 xanthine dehydrogenase D subunit [Prauserella sediminis]MCR3721540.1 xanthine dehydrogenase, molybdenum binding subunit apoprotein [Prauserella flava]MCR3734232.1 xanthine dehydrogenase, molybdenum binding subunit apoprotein [Prauserella salsuginis]
MNAHGNAPSRTPQDLSESITGGVGESPSRPDGNLKVRGDYAYSSDLWAEDMLWGATLRSPHPYARITGIDIARALAYPGVYAVLTHEDVPGDNRYGLKITDQPVLAEDVVRFRGEAVALVAADHPETARRALELIAVDYEVLEPVTDPKRAAHDETLPKLHPDSGRENNLVRYQPIVRGRQDVTAEVVVSGTYTLGMQDQAFLGPESGLAIPAEDGGVELFLATQDLHSDRKQTARALGLPPDKVRMTMSGVGGAFGGREDLSIQVHVCMLAMHTGKPVKMVYNREESFYGHVHRHPAEMHFEHGATRDGDLVYVKARMYFDGGAYASKTPVVVGNATTLGTGPYEVPNVDIAGWGVYTNNPPCGAMRGLGAVQPAFAYEAQMDKLARALDMDPVELRQRNAVAQGSVLHTGQQLDYPAPVGELLERARKLPMPPERDPAAEPDIRDLPGGAANTTHGEDIARGVGYAAIIKNVSYAEGADDYSTARVSLQAVGGEAVAMVHTAAAEVGQGLVTVQQQIARTELGVERVNIHPNDTSVGEAGSSSASRQTYVTGGAVKAACEAVRETLFDRAAAALGHTPPDLAVVDGKLVSESHGVLADVVDVLGDGVIECTREYHHRPTYPLDPETGQSELVHVQHAFSVHRAVVDVDTQLGLVKVVALDCVQDVGKAVNPDAIVGQIQGGATQGMGLAVMEEIQVSDGLIRNPSFTDYLIPTILDTPPMKVDIIERGDPHAPYGVRGVGEPPTISAGPAVLAAIRAATGIDLTHAPAGPEHITGTAH